MRVGATAVDAVTVGDAPGEGSLDEMSACVASTVAKVHSRNAWGFRPCPGYTGGSAVRPRAGITPRRFSDSNRWPPV
ncbi:hypothetical protein GCM10010449_54960 [Streptomyces rectiviolaceus]|uniref:Uncharacterized protein n=1 Tax=Streptomyces rectiviolaceus TaxID=332591 RepID=A0ABP6MZI2_9ACTN